MLNRIETAVVRESVIVREYRTLIAQGAKRKGTVYHPERGHIIGFNFGTSVRPDVSRITVNAIAPGFTLSERIAATHKPVPADIASVAIVMNRFEMRYPGTLNMGPVFRSFSDVLMSAAYCCTSVLSCGRFEFKDLFALDHAARNRLVSVTQVRDDAALPTLSCRIEITLTGGKKIVESLIDGGKELAIDSSTIDAWVLDLWKEAGRSEGQYRKFRAAVDALPSGSAKGLLETLQP